MRPATLILLLCACSNENPTYQCGPAGDPNPDTTITAKDAVIEARDMNFIAWTYDGDVPGPILRMNVGDTRRIQLVNQSARPVSLHFHGVLYANADDGSTPEGIVNPGCAHTYTIHAVTPGVWAYHSHVDSRMEMARGLGGAVVVPAPGEMPADHEYVVLLGQLGLEDMGGSGAEPTDSDEGGAAPEGHVATLNGRPDGNAEVIELSGDHYAVRTGMASAKVGDRVRWRVLNVSPDDLHTFHLHGHRWDFGGVSTDNVALAPAQGASFEFVEDNPGQWMYHCHVLDHVGDGMWAMYEVTPLAP